jgi:guanylate kinase
MKLLIKPLIICGPSGVGKGTLIKKMTKIQNTPFMLNLSYTTR